MAIYSVLLAAGNGDASAPLSVFTAPETGVVVVRDIVLMHADTTNRRVAAWVLSGSTVSMITSKATVVPLEEQHWQGRQVLLPGDQLFVYMPTTATLYWRLSGYQLGL